MKVYPTLAASRNDGFIPGPWSITEGQVRRGCASCDVNNRVLEVPTGDEPAARVVRAHELCHAKVSPLSETFSRALDMDVLPRALMCAEEARVNWIIGAKGFDVELLADGSEKDEGARVAFTGDWSEAVCFLAAAVNTGAQKPFLLGLRKAQPTWGTPLRTIAKRITQILSENSIAVTSSTNIIDGVPEGFAEVTIPIARVLTTAMGAQVPTDAADNRLFRRSLEPGARRPATGHFADLVWATQPEFEGIDRRGSIRRAKPSNSGVHVQYPSRLLTDTKKRVFAKKAHASGGIVVIDQSGSMDVNQQELRAFARTHPRATLIGYSHTPGDIKGTPNAWILASNGKVATTSPDGNIGNGVDGPILRWALRQRIGNEPIVWVCDGQVTDSNDHPGQVLTTECAQLVVKNRITMVRTLGQVARALANPRVPRPSEYDRYGRLGKEFALSRNI
jgi:hypothetical protein